MVFTVLYTQIYTPIDLYTKIAQPLWIGAVYRLPAPNCVWVQLRKYLENSGAPRYYDLQCAAPRPRPALDVGRPVRTNGPSLPKLSRALAPHCPPPKKNLRNS